MLYSSREKALGTKLIIEVLLLLNEPGRAWDGDPSFLFKKFSFYNINNQLAKVGKNLSAGSISVE